MYTFPSRLGHFRPVPPVCQYPPPLIGTQTSAVNRCTETTRGAEDVKSTSYRQIRGKRGGGMWTVGQQPPCLPINQRQLDNVPIPLDGPDRTRPEKVRGLSGRVRSV